MSEEISRVTVVTGLRNAVTVLEADRLGSPALLVPLSALHFFKNAEGDNACAIDAHAVVSLAENLMREAKA